MIRSLVAALFLSASALAPSLAQEAPSQPPAAQAPVAPEAAAPPAGPAAPPAAARPPEAAPPAEAAVPPAAAAPPEPVWRHALSLLDEPKYPADFARFDYVNPDAPKGGTLRLGSVGTFDTLNFVVPLGTLPEGLGLVYETLMTPSYDEPSAEYGLLAEAVSYPEDYSSVTYRLREQARWHDGEPVTPEDVIWSFEAVKEHNPTQGFYYRHVVGAEKTGPREVTFTFDEPGNRELPQIVGQILVMPKHYWEGTDAQGRQRDITAGTLEPPLSSGPYRIASATPARQIVYERVEDYWGTDLAANVGRNNFDRISYDYYRDDTVELQGFLGGQYDFRVEASARNWATGYETPAKRAGEIVLETFPDRGSGVMQAFAFNIRREKFQDPRVRQAFNFAINFEELNQSLFYGQYKRIDSYFEGTELEADGVPQGLELEILESVRDQVPPQVFEADYTNPQGGDQRVMRTNLREAVRLLKEAGWEVQDGRLANVETGEAMQVEFLIAQPSFERIILRYQQNLETLGIASTIRSVDISQYINRVRERDFDVIVNSWGQSLSPGNEQLDFWGSEAADRPGSRNAVGIKNEAVDTIIRRIIFAKDREELVAATRALDRVLLWNHYVVPQWTADYTRTARWDRFSYPDPLPEYSFGFPNLWWYDEAKAGRLARN